MAETNKTHQPTSRRLSKSREAGDVPYSVEVESAVTLIALTAILVLVGPYFMSWCKMELQDGLNCRAEMLDNSQVFVSYANSKILSVLKITAPFFAVMMVFGILSNIMVSGLNFTTQPLAWKFDNLSPVKGIKQLFKPEALMDLLLSVVKMTFIALIVYTYLLNKIEYFTKLQWADTDRVMSMIGDVVLGCLIRICLGLLVIAAADWFYRKWKYIDKLKMSREEVKEENRSTEGAPEVKARIRRKQFEIGMKRMLKKVPQANVILVNPTHVAVALQYEPGKSAAPIVVAKGADHMCEKIKDIARAYGVPIIRRPPLAREIYASVKLDHPIPEKLFTAVAEVLAVIYRLKHTYSKK